MLEFHKFLFEKFIEWERKQPKKRSSYSAFARYLSENSRNITVSQPSLDAWLNNKYAPSEKYIPLLAEKLGPEVYDVLNLPPPDPILTYIVSQWNKLTPQLQKQIKEQVDQYLTPSQNRRENEQIN